MMRESEGSKIVREKMPKIIDYFTRVYGEEYRDRIEARLDNTIFIFMDCDKKGALHDEEKLNGVEELIGGDIVFDYIDNAIDAGVDAAGNFTSAYYYEPTKPVNICVLPEMAMCNDAILIHELGHIIESDVKLDGRDFRTHTGFMVSKYKVDFSRRMTKAIDDVDPVQWEQLEYLNEVINDYLTLSVVKLMEKEGFKIFDNEKTSSFYSLAFPALQDFIDRVSPHLIHSGCRGRLKDLRMLIGQDEFTKFIDDLYFLFQKYGDDRLYIQKFLKDNNLSAYGLMRERDLSWLPEKVRGYIKLCDEIENDIGERMVNEHILIPDSDERGL